MGEEPADVTSDATAEVVARATEAARSWLPMADRIEAMLEPLHEVLLPAASLRTGERVIDVGCGTGATAVVAARTVGPTGYVTAIDAARNVIERGKQKPLDDNHATIDWVVGDGQRHQFETEGADVVLSRLGVMFFDDFTAALANLAQATRPGGRFAGIVWLPKDQSPFHHRSLAVAVATATEYGWPIDLPASDVGPFGFASDATLSDMEDAGWSNARLEPSRVWLYAGGSGTTSDTVARDFVMPQLSAQLLGAPEGVADAVEQAIGEDLEACWDGTGVRLDAMVAVIMADRP
jgi:SAM-dependent methyltransferase